MSASSILESAWIVRLLLVERAAWSPFACSTRTQFWASGHIASWTRTGTLTWLDITNNVDQAVLDKFELAAVLAEGKHAPLSRITSTWKAGSTSQVVRLGVPFALLCCCSKRKLFPSLHASVRTNMQSGILPRFDHTHRRCCFPGYATSQGHRYF